jgi:phospholipid transport system substrate-binding protein
MTTPFRKASAAIGLILFAIAGLFSLPQTARADDIGAAKELVGALAAEATESFAGKTLPLDARSAKLQDMISRYGDVPTSSRDILGHYWTKASTDQQNAFVAVVVDYAIQSWAKQVSDLPRGQHIDITSAEVNAAGRTIIHSLAINGGDMAAVDWMLTRTADDRLVITDVSVDGVSIIQTMKGDFTAIIRANGGKLDALLDALRGKIASYQAAADGK